MYINQSLKNYLEDLSARKPTPGGGSVAALISSLGTALITMVCNFTIGKSQYKEVEKEVKEIKEENESIRSRLMELIDLDILSYEKVESLRRLIKKSSENKGELLQKLQDSIKKAIAIPLEVCQLSIQALKNCKDLVDKSNINLISDLFISTILLKSGFQSALINVEVNLTCLEDSQYAAEVKKIIDPLIKENEIIPEIIQKKIRERMKIR